MAYLLWSWWWAAALTAAAMAFWLLQTIRRKPNLPPGPPGLPILGLGYFPFLGTHLHKTFTELSQVHGPIYKLWLGHKIYVVVGSPLLAKQVRDNDIMFANHEPVIASRVLTYGANDIAFSTYGPEWKKLRKVFVRELLSKSRLDASYVLRKQQVGKAVEDVYRKMRGKAVDFGQLVFMTISNTILSMLWGSTFHGKEGERFFSRVRELSSEFVALQGAANVSDLIPGLARFDLQGIERKSRMVLEGLDGIFCPAIDERRKKLVEKTEKEATTKDFLQILLELNSPADDASSITDNQLKGILVDAIIGGTDTTSTTIEWTMVELMRNPDAMQKVIKELDEVVGRNYTVEEFHLPKLYYLDAAIKEALRLHPTVPILVPRCARGDCKLGGYTIPKGATVVVNAYAIHRDPHFWNSPLEFRPERFLGENAAAKFDYLGNSSQYFPFGTGRRVCAGLPVAEKILKYLLASLLHSFEWRLAHGTQVDLTDKFGIVVKLEKPLVLVPTPSLANPELY